MVVAGRFGPGLLGMKGNGIYSFWYSSGIMIYVPCTVCCCYGLIEINVSFDHKKSVSWMITLDHNVLKVKLICHSFID